MAAVVVEAEAATPVAVATAPHDADGAQKRRRRRGGRGRRTDQVVATDPAARSDAVTAAPREASAALPASEGHPRLRVRIKQAIKSWIRRLGMPRTQR